MLVSCRRGERAAKGMSPMATKRDSRRTGRQRDLGQSIVEMALITPIFLLICLGILDFGRAFYDYERIQNAAREGAMWLGSHPSTTVALVTNRVQSEGIACGGGEAVQVTEAALLKPDTLHPGQYLITTDVSEATDARVSVSCRFDIVSAWFRPIVGEFVTLTGRAQMPVTSG
jgi:hypothetical protein